MSVEETRGAIAEAVTKAGESDAALEEVKNSVSAALATATEALQNIQFALGNAQADTLASAMAHYQNLESKCRYMLEVIEEAQQAARAGTENAETYLGYLSQ